MLRKRTTWLVLTVTLAAVAAAGGVYAAVAKSDTRTVIERTTTVDTFSAATSSLDAHRVYERTYKGVVEITGSQTVSTNTPLGDNTQKEIVEGSGFVYDTKGHVITNYHVVKGTSSITVDFVDGSTYPASVVGDDPSTDLAVLKVDAPARALLPLSLGDSSKVQVGESVLAIGSPFGLAETMTNGIVSALDRTMSSENAYSISGAIQTDAAINHGNSGGPLLNSSGQVIGVNSQIESEGGGSEGIGFAISSNTVSFVVKQLLANGKVAHAYLGVSVTSPATGAGALVGSVRTGSPAAAAGLKTGDVIKAFNGKKVLTPGDLIGAVNADQPGQKASIAYTHNGATKIASVTLTNRSS